MGVNLESRAIISYFTRSTEVFLVGVHLNSTEVTLANFNIKSYLKVFFFFFLLLV